MAEPMPEPMPERRATPPRAEADWSRVRTFLAGASSAVVVLLAFLIPSLQDQWDRRQTRIAVDRYVAVGERLLKEDHFESAEQSFERASRIQDGYRHVVPVARPFPAARFEDPQAHDVLQEPDRAEGATLVAEVVTRDG